MLKENLIVGAVEPNLQMRKFGIKNCKFSKVSWTIIAENTKLIDNSLYSIFGSSINVVDYKKVFKEIKVLIKNGFSLFMES